MILFLHRNISSPGSPRGACEKSIPPLKAKTKRADKDVYLVFRWEISAEHTLVLFTYNS